MSLKRWFENGWLRRHQTSYQEIADLMMIVDRDLQDAKAGVSDNWRFGIAYNAALKLCTTFNRANPTNKTNKTNKSAS